ncbi:hypothetical protein Tco_0045079 [Tanacetum coccineum]
MVSKSSSKYDPKSRRNRNLQSLTTSKMMSNIQGKQSHPEHIQQSGSRGVGGGKAFNSSVTSSGDKSSSRIAIRVRELKEEMEAQ